jgi:hypothetical protein
MTSLTIASTGSKGSRGVSDVSVKEAFANLLVSVQDVVIRSVLSKIKSCESLETNSRAVISSKVPELRATLSYLRGIEGDTTAKEISNLRQAGLVHCILLEVANLLPYRCSLCVSSVINQRLEEPSVTCRGCGVGACPQCFSKAELGWSFMCPPCGSTYDKTRLIPNHLLKSRTREKSSVSQLSNAKESTSTDVTEEVLLEEVEDTNESNEDLSLTIRDSQESLPLGQGSPPRQSTQAENSAGPVRGFPDFSLDLTSTQERVSILTPAGSEAVIADTAVDTSEVFIEPPKRVKADRRKQKQALITQEKSNISSDDPDSNTCRFFMKGNCRFGFFGKGKNGQGKCPFKHPKACKKLMDNGCGQGGCSKGKACEDVHPKMCNQSIQSRSCSNIKDGARCPAGYHVRGTKYFVSKPLGSTISFSNNSKSEMSGQRGQRGQKKDKVANNVSSASSYIPIKSAIPISNGNSEGDQHAALNSVFHKIIRAEVVKLLQTGTLWPQPVSQSCGPVVPVPVQRGQGPTTTMGNLGALLSLLGAHQQH